MTTYYADLDLTSTGGDGSEGNSWHADTFRIQSQGVLADGSIIKTKGSHAFGAMAVMFSGVGSTAVTITSWDDTPWRISAERIYTNGTGTIVENGILQVTYSFGEASGTNSGSGEYRNCFIKCAGYFGDYGEEGLIVKGCTLISSQIGSSTISFLDSIINAVLHSGDTNDYVNCVITQATFPIGASTLDCQANWTPPSWSAWDAAQSAFSSMVLSVDVDTPPEAGNPPYTGYATGLWGSTRSGIGAMDFQAVSQALLNTTHSIGGTTIPAIPGVMVDIEIPHDIAAMSETGYSFDHWEITSGDATIALPFQADASILINSGTVVNIKAVFVASSATEDLMAENNINNGSYLVPIQIGM